MAEYGLAENSITCERPDLRSKVMNVIMRVNENEPFLFNWDRLNSKKAVYGGQVEL